MTLYLGILPADEISLPAGIAESTLTLAQIGALTCMACLQKYNADMTPLATRVQSDEMVAAMKELSALGVFRVSNVDGSIQMEVDLSSVMP